MTFADERRALVYGTLLDGVPTAALHVYEVLNEGIVGESPSQLPVCVARRTTNTELLHYLSQFFNERGEEKNCTECVARTDRPCLQTLLPPKGGEAVSVKPFVFFPFPSPPPPFPDWIALSDYPMSFGIGGEGGRPTAL